jgi:hypothetical protein
MVNNTYKFKKGASMSENLKKRKKENAQESTHSNNERSSYYNNGGVYNPQTEVGITGAYGSQGERDRDNSYVRSIKF